MSLPMEMGKRTSKMNYYLAILLPLLLSSLLLVTYQLAQPPSGLKPKVFVLGLSKTGTTSIGDALALLGYKRLGWKDIRSRQLVHAFINGDRSALIEQTKHFDAFEDLPWPYMYQDMAVMFPDAKFVLSLRKDEQTWLRSMQRHQSRGVWQPAVHFYGSQDIENDGEVVLNAYRNHTDGVRQFFQDMPDRYTELVVDDDGEVNWRKLCRVAQCPEGRVPAIDFPRSNTIADWREDSIVGSFHKFWGWTVSRLEEGCVEFYYNRDWPIARAILDRVWGMLSFIDLACANLYFKIAVQGQPPLPWAS